MANCLLMRLPVSAVHTIKTRIIMAFKNTPSKNYDKASPTELDLVIQTDRLFLYDGLAISTTKQGNYPDDDCYYNNDGDNPDNRACFKNTGNSITTA